VSDPGAKYYLLMYVAFWGWGYCTLYFIL
jgi:hypothetical protein